MTATCCPPPEVHRLSIVSLESRNPIQLSPLAGPHVGLPFVAEPNASLRDLTIEQTEDLAARSSPIAQAIQSERSILCQSSSTPCSVIDLLDLQTTYERNQSAGQAMRAYLNLVEVHLQHELIVESTGRIDEAIATVERLRENQVTVPTDDREFDRQQLELDEKTERLRHQHYQLSGQLEALLSLDRRYDSPLWTNFQSREFQPLELGAELAAAFENRTDLAVLQRLAHGDDSNDMLEWLRGAASSASPLLGIVAKGGLFGLCQPADEQESEGANRRCQVANLARAKRDSIAMDVADAVDSIATRLRVIELKRKAIASIEESQAAAVQGKDLQPVDLKNDLQQKLQLLQVRSELIHEIIECESDLVRLRQAQGVLGRNLAPGSFAGVKR